MKLRAVLFYTSAHRAMESVTLDKETAHAKERIMPAYAELVYNGYWFSKKRVKTSKNY